MDRLLIMLGIILIVAPFLGIYETWKMYIVVGIGLIIILISILRDIYK